MKNEQDGMSREEKLFRAIGEVGGDLIDMAEKRVFTPSRWRRWGSIAACLAVILCLSTLALPYFPMGCGSSAPNQNTSSDENLAVSADTAPADTAPEEVDPADSGTTEESPETPGIGTEETDGVEAGRTKEQLVFLNTVYYPEALYSAEEARGYLSDYLGTVTDADQASLIGAPVYLKSGSSVRQDGDTGVPLEIFVETGDGYLYCLTYYASAGAYFTFDQAQALWERGQEEALLQRFVMTLELGCPELQADPAAEAPYPWEGLLDFSSPSELTARQLEYLFSLLLNQQTYGGYRSYDQYSYLWFQQETPEGPEWSGMDGCFVIPMADVTGTLDRYLDGYTLDPAQMDGYDAERDALILSTISGLGGERWLHIQTARFDAETQTMVLTVVKYGDASGETVSAVREYTIRFAGGCCYYDSIVTAAA